MRATVITCDRCKAVVSSVPQTATQTTPRTHLPTGDIQHDGGPGNDSGPVVRCYDLCRDCLLAEHNTLLMAAVRTLGKEQYLALLREAKLSAPKGSEEWLIT